MSLVMSRPNSASSIIADVLGESENMDPIPMEMDFALDWIDIQNFSTRGVTLTRHEKCPGTPISFSKRRGGQEGESRIGPLAAALCVADYLHWQTVVQFVQQERRGANKLLSYYKYLVFQTPSKLYEFMSNPIRDKLKTCAGHRAVSEVVRQGFYIRPYLDVEAVVRLSHGQTIEKECILFENSVQKAMRAALEKMGIPPAYAKRVCVTRNTRLLPCGNTKFSSHAIAMDVYYDNNTDGQFLKIAGYADDVLKQFWLLGQDVGHSIVDMVVYNKNRAIRVIGASKPGNDYTGVLTQEPMSMADISDADGSTEHAFVKSLIVVGRNVPVAGYLITVWAQRRPVW